MLDIKLPQSEEIETKLAEAGLDALDYYSRGRQYPIRLDKGDITKHAELLKSLMRRAYDIRHA